MEVTKSNFKKALPIVKQAIEECAFLAIDTELTGLHREQKAHAFDTMEQRYEKICEASKGFLVIQVGISCFQFHKETKKYTHKDFNFYVFPRQHCSQVTDSIFISSASSLNFLSSCNFNFNKLIYEGVSYLTPVQEAQVQRNLKTTYADKLSDFAKQIEENKGKSTAPPANIPEEHADFISDILIRIESYIASNRTDSLSLPPCSRYRRKLIYQTVQHKYPSGLSLNTVSPDKNGYISVTKMNDNEKLHQLEEKHKSSMNDLEDAVGFRKVLDLISQSKKLVLGHNMLLDLFHIINQFYYPVPATLDEFKDILKCIFPLVADTKLFAATALKSYGVSTALFELQEEISTRNFPQPPIEPAENHECYGMGQEKMHEAGFDAFTTGAVFIYLMAKLAEDNKVEHIDPDHKLMRPYVNRPYVMRHFDVNSINLYGPDPQGVRENVYHVTFPKQWKTVDLIELFSPYSEIHVCWVDDVSAFVALKSPEQCINVRRTLLKNTGSLYKIITYAEYQEKHLFKVPSTSKNHNEAEIPQKKVRNNSGGSGDGSATNRSITPIQEEEEDSEEDVNMERQDNCVSTSLEPNSGSSSSQNSHDSVSPRAKRQKTIQAEPEDPEVSSSTSKMFEESDTW